MELASKAQDTSTQVAIAKIKDSMKKDLEELRELALTDPQRVSESIAVDKFLSNLKDIDLKRVEAFNALSGEREYQESLYKKTGQDPISIPGELALLKVYLDKAFVTYADTFGDPGEKPTMDIIRKITAIGLRALENYGCPLRDIKGSLAARPPEHRAEVESEELKRVREFEEDPRNIRKPISKPTSGLPPRF